MENFYTTVQTTTGNVVNGATVTVYDASSGLPATIYEPDGVTPLANPFLSGYARSEGEIEFGAANGQYSIKIVNGAEEDWIYRITLFDTSLAGFGALAFEDDASGVPVADAGGYFVSTDVEGALQEAGAHIVDPTDAHDASAISVADAGGYFTGTDAESVLQEVGIVTSAVGTMAYQDANSVNISGGTIDGTAIGGTTPAAGTFTEAKKTGTGVADTDLPGFSQLALSVGRITNPLVDLRSQNGLNLVSGVGSVTFARASTADYVDRYGVLKTAATDEPRFEEGGLLIEGSNTNLVTYSEDFTNAAWVKRGTATATASAVVGPDGTNTMFLLAGLGAGGTDDIYQTVGTLTASARYEPSVWMQQATSTTGIIRLRTKATTTTFGQWSIDVSLLSATEPERITRYHPAVTVDVEFTGDGAASQHFALSSDGTATDVYAWGAQFEDAPFSTSYIPTTTTALTRSADFPALQFDGNFPAINTGELTIIVDYDRIGLKTAQNVASISGISGSLFIRASQTGNNVRQFRYGTNSSTATIESISSERISGRFDGTNRALFVDGIKYDEEAAEAISGTPTAIALGTGTGDSLYGHISRVRIYDVVLTDAEMRIA